MLMKKISLKNILAISILCFLPTISKAENIVRDSETEAAIYEAVLPILKAADLKDLKIILIDNPEVNAFTLGAEEIFVNTGLIVRFPDPDVFKGVIAHELGHLLGHHVSRRFSDLENTRKKALLGLALGVAGTIATQDPEVFTLGAVGSRELAEKSFLKYSRAYESSADQAAYKLLEKSGNSAIGMKFLFEHFIKESRGAYIDKYSLTHPVSSERLNTTIEYLNNSKYKSSTTSELLKHKFERVSYKLAAFTSPNPALFLQGLASIKDTNIRKYAEAICLMRLSKFQEAIASVDYLLSKFPDDTYFNELKGEILLAYGKKESLEFFEKALSLAPRDNLMRMNVAIAALNVYRYDRKENLQKYLQYIHSVRIEEPEILGPYYYLAEYYGILGEDYLSKLYLAIYYDKLDMKEAKKFAKWAIKGLKPDSAQYYWAKDIIDRDAN
mgnify:CR=1 FL=1